MNEIEEVEGAELGRRLGLTRRQLMAATVGVAAAAAASTAFTAGAAHAHPTPAAGPGGGNGVLVPPGKRGIILYSVRDAISRNPLTSDLPSGFREVLEELSRIGYKQIEFAGYRQNANSEGGADLGTVAGATLLRSWLDANGLEAEGNHGSIPSTINATTMAQFDTACEIANILGFGHIGTGSDPTNSAQKGAWDTAIDVWNFWGARAASHGLKLYTHNHDAAYSFLLDSGPLDGAGNFTRSSGIRRLEYFLQNTDPAAVYLEMDVYWAHVAQYRYSTFTAPDGTIAQNVFDPAGLVAAQPIRYPLFHAKDGRSNPATTNGYEIVPFGQGDIDYTTFFQRVGAKGYHNPMWEQDNAPGNAITAPGQSLQYAASSFDALAALRG